MKIMMKMIAKKNMMKKRMISNQAVLNSLIHYFINELKLSMIT